MYQFGKFRFFFSNSLKITIFSFATESAANVAERAVGLLAGGVPFGGIDVAIVRQKFHPRHRLRRAFAHNISGIGGLDIVLIFKIIRLQILEPRRIAIESEADGVGDGRFARAGIATDEKQRRIRKRRHGKINGSLRQRGKV